MTRRRTVICGDDDSVDGKRQIGAFYFEDEVFQEQPITQVLQQKCKSGMIGCKKQLHWWCRLYSLRIKGESNIKCKGLPRFPRTRIHTWFYCRRCSSHFYTKQRGGKSSISYYFEQGISCRHRIPVPLPYYLCMKSMSYVFTSRMVFFYLGTTNWIFYISLSENSIKIITK